MLAQVHNKRQSWDKEGLGAQKMIQTDDGDGQDDDDDDDAGGGLR